ncbi:MAG: Hsp33 family molecular chaperone HslO [Pseudomonadota bacterium]|nr:Hsp33 family molecular chaperone HslO [Pseudomonadota bacterium]
MSNTDISHRFIINDSGVRGQWTLLDASYQTVLAKHDYPLEVQSVLGEMMAAAILLSATLKFEGSMIIQARGEHVVSLLSVECTHDHKLRAIARWDGDTQGMDFRTMLGNATLAITITPLQGERYQGIVPLDGATLSACLEHYFQRSEQLRTQIQLFHGNNRAGGLLVQVLPAHSRIKVDPQQQLEEWERITALASTLTAEELLNLDCATVLRRLFHEESVELFPAEAVAFECSCSRQRTADALAQIGRGELEEIIAEQGRIEVTCQYCNELYRFDAVDVAMLFTHGATDSNGDSKTIN